MKILLRGTALALGIGALLWMPSPLAPQIGAIDFRAYWSASYLLIHGEDFSDPQRLFQIERELTNWQENYPMITWNPPWLLSLLSPFALVPFARAVWWWVLTNIALAFTSAILLWRATCTRESVQKSIWIPLALVFGSSVTLTTLAAGQVNLIVLVGLAGFLFLKRGGHETSAGVALALTTVKPQLVYVVVPIFLLDCLRTRRWRTLVGFGGALLGLTLFVLVFRPQFVLDYGATMSQGRLLDWETPTLGGWLDFLLGWKWSKLIGLVVLPIVIILWWRARTHINTRTFVDTTLLLSIITAPFGWSYDYVVLVVPLARVIAWIAEGLVAPRESRIILLILVAANLVVFYQRILTPSEIYFFWIPLLTGVVYAFTWARQRQVQVIQE